MSPRERATPTALPAQGTRTGPPGSARNVDAILGGLGLGLAATAVGLGLAGRAIPALLVLAAGLGLAGRAYARSRRETAQMASMLAGQTQVLEMAATDGALGEVLDALCLLVERQEPGLISSVLLLDGDRLRDVAGPSLPVPYRRAIDGVAIGPDVGSCGTAAFTRQPVVAHDIASDPRWVAYRDVALRHGLLACWSAPILTADGESLGTFAMYYREQRRPGPREWRLLEAAANIARLAIIRARTADALAASRRRLEEESQVAGALVRAGRGLIASQDKPDIVERLCQLTTELLGLDASLALLHDPVDDTYLALAAHGHPASRWTALQDRRYPAAEIAPLLARAGTAPALALLPDDAAPAAEAALRQDLGPGACLLIPLRHGGECLGLLGAGRRDPVEGFTPVQERIAAGIGHFAALALENAHLMEELAAATQHRLEFISTISHELRTPLGVILGYAEMLGDDAAPADRAAWLARIQRAGGELLDLIDATLNLNRLEAGQDAPRLEPVALRAFFGDLAGDFAGVPCPHGVALRWEPGDDVTFVTDRRKLRMILKNLIGNALKFTTAGSITARYRVGPETCTFEVEDTGTGIEPEHLPVIFEMFRQADGSDRRSFSGVGLGLHIVRRLANQLGGNVRVESEPGRGSTFTVSLPAGRDETRLSA